MVMMSCAEGDATGTAELLPQLVAAKRGDLLSLYSCQQIPHWPWALQHFLSRGERIRFTHPGKNVFLFLLAVCLLF